MPTDASGQQTPPQGMDGQEPPERPEGQEPTGNNGENPDGQEPPENSGGRPDGMGPGGMGADGTTSGGAATGEGSTEFTLTDSVHTFSAQIHVGEDGTVTISDIQASAALEASHVQLSITDIPSEDYAAACLLSDGEDALAECLPTDPGTYQLTTPVAGDNSYSGTTLFQFTIPEQ